MRLCVFAVLLIHFSAANWAAAEPSFPYTVYVQADDVYVRSGPGKNYYPTDKLALGEEVEVWRHDPGGWLAIRPPRNSFSWVSSKYLSSPDQHNIATVTGDRVVARVGTTFSDMRDVIQVRLEQGETVELLESPRGASLGHDAWCKIAPPSGEFRWISSKYVARNKPGEEPGVAATTVDEEVRLSSAEVSGEFDDEAGSEIASAGTSRPSAAPTIGGRSASSAAISAESAADLFQAELNEIDLALTKMVAEEPSVWSFVQLNSRAESLVAGAQTAVERGRARLLLSKIARFEEMQQRYQAVSQAAATIEQKTAGHGDTVRIPTESPIRPVAAKLEASGRLTPVVSRRPGAPTFALVRPNNEVECFITPAPGVNLQPYVGQSIGVEGQRGFMPELNKPHVTASRITVMR